MAWYNTVQYSTVQHSTVQYNTLQHRIEQHCTYQHIILWRRPSWWVSQSSLWLLSTAEHQQADSSNAFAPTPIHKNSINKWFVMSWKISREEESENGMVTNWSGSSDSKTGRKEVRKGIELSNIEAMHRLTRLHCMCIRSGTYSIHNTVLTVHTACEYVRTYHVKRSYSACHEEPSTKSSAELCG